MASDFVSFFKNNHPDIPILVAENVLIELIVDLAFNDTTEPELLRPTPAQSAKEAINFPDVRAMIERPQPCRCTKCQCSRMTRSQLCSECRNGIHDGRPRRK